MSSPSVISLFSGAGGLDYGFEAAGYRIAAAVEMDPRCCEALRRNRDWTVLERDATTLPGNELLTAAGLKVGKVDALIGGPPCQPFSKAGFWATGQAGRLSDPRADTLDAYLRLVQELQPKAFLLENVDGLGFRGKDEGLRLIQARISEINRETGARYKTSIGVLNAADFGVPQVRKRLFVVGSRAGSQFRFPTPTHGPQGSGLGPWLTAWDAFHDLPKHADPQAYASGKWAALLPTIPPGRNYLWHTERGGGEPLFGWRRRYWTFLLKLAADQPSSTLQAQPGPATGPFHWESRRLTPREMARLQTFPDSVQLAADLREAQRQLGNAVPSLLAEVLAREISTQVLGRPAETLRPRLTLRRALKPPPGPAALEVVPARYHELRGRHLAHPGSGRGARAIQLMAAE